MINISKWIVLIYILVSAEIAFSQSVNGVIIDEYYRPVANAEIVDQRSGNHVHSDVNGKFSLGPIENGDSIQVFSVGFLPRVIEINQVDTFYEIVLEERRISLEEVVIRSSLDAMNVITDIDLELNPVTSSQDVLRVVPGLFIGQHAGGGKAEQIFLRGFDVDHGTDVTVNVDGMPVNMVSHAHGQGYADLHFVIPETIEKVDYGKGPYYAHMGDFNTAGYVTYNTKNSLDRHSLNLELGQFNHRRILGMFNIANSLKNKAYIATEFLTSDGPFESPQNLQRLNVFGKYATFLSVNDRVELIFSHFKSDWDASGQIPQRAVDQDLISRFGAIDNTEGGLTGRSHISFKYDKTLSDHALISNQIYYTKYDFELYSNFTFFLEDEENGDQIRQKENRDIFGFASKLNYDLKIGKIALTSNHGLTFRNDIIRDNELSHTKNRSETLITYQKGDILQSSYGLFTDWTAYLGKWTVNTGARFDYFDFQYIDKNVNQYGRASVQKGIVSPKLSLLYAPTVNVQLYLKTGKGFHSNDARVSIPRNAKEILPAAYGVDVGLLWKPIKRLLLNLCLWNLYMEQEFVYVGDAGIVEPSGRTSRRGVELSARYQPSDRIFLFADINATHARSIDEITGADYIPLAPDFTLTAGGNFRLTDQFSGGVYFRKIGNRPANEFNTIVAEGYDVVDANLSYAFKSFSVGCSIQNLFNVEWNETQFATESRLQNEEASTEEIHFIPGTPFNVRGMLKFNF